MGQRRGVEEDALARRFASLSIAIFAVMLVASTPFGSDAIAQDASAPAKPKYDKYGSPLDTIMSSRLWSDVAPAQDFVKESRPDAKSLDYTPLTGEDPERDKPRDKANVEALRAELERDGAVNDRKGGVRHAAVKPRPKARHEKASATE